MVSTHYHADQFVVNFVDIAKVCNLATKSASSTDSVAIPANSLDDTMHIAIYVGPERAPFSMVSISYRPVSYQREWPGLAKRG